MLKPLAGRRLPPELRPDAVYAAAPSLEGGLGGAALRRLLEAIDQSDFHDDTQVQLYFRGAEAMAAMLRAIAQAREEVLLESYIVRADSTGRAFGEALRAARARGVRVSVLADGLGSGFTRRDYWRLLRDGGTRLKLFGRPAYAPLTLLPIVDHRKLLIIDRELAFTGGMNIADEYHLDRPEEPAWRDTHLCVRGEVAQDLAALFAESWEAAGGQPLRFASRPQAQPGGTPTIVLDSRPGRGLNEVYASFAAVLGGARQRVWISNAYFAPQRRMLRYLQSCSGRGVDVRLLLPRHTDMPLVRWASQSYYAGLLAAGVRIYEYLPAVLHAKTLLADEAIGIVGSSNFDFRSFDLNHECNLLFQDDAINARLAQQFEQDLTQAEEIDARRWAARPWWLRALNALARLFAPLM